MRLSTPRTCSPRATPRTHPWWGAAKGLGRARCRGAVWLLALVLATACSTAAGTVRALAAGPPDAQLAFIEQLYQEGDAYRAESEVLRFLHARPADPAVPQVELLRAKLYYRDARWPDARLMLYALLDRHPGGPAATDARRLLTFTHLRLGQPGPAAETAFALAQQGAPAPAPAELERLLAPPPDAVDVDAAVTWSTWLPGTGYFLLGEPGKAVTGLSLNLALLGATAYAVRQENMPAALLFLALEGMLWQGGRSGVRQDALARNQRLRTERLESWLVAHGEGDLLRVGLSLPFGGG